MVGNAAFRTDRHLLRRKTERRVLCCNGNSAAQHGDFRCSFPHTDVELRARYLYLRNIRRDNERACVVTNMKVRFTVERKFARLTGPEFLHAQPRRVIQHNFRAVGKNNAKMFASAGYELIGTINGRREVEVRARDQSDPDDAENDGPKPPLNAPTNGHQRSTVQRSLQAQPLRVRFGVNRADARGGLPDEHIHTIRFGSRAVRGETALQSLQQYSQRSHFGDISPIGTRTSVDA
jgi:hypothetical protein